MGMGRKYFQRFILFVYLFSCEGIFQWFMMMDQGCPPDRSYGLCNFFFFFFKSYLINKL